MKTLLLSASLALGIFAVLSSASAQQNLPSSFSFSITGAFDQPVSDTGGGPTLIDNDLTNGHATGFDLTDAPAGLTPSGPLGAAAFQWGTPIAFSSYPVPSALWFEPSTPPVHATVEQPFSAGFLHFRNGILQPGSGVTGVDLLLGSPDSPGTIAPFSLSILDSIPASGSFLTTTASVSLDNLFSPIPFVDCFGDPYFVELAFAEDLDFGDGSYTWGNELRVAEGVVGRAEIIGRFTTSPIPEPSSLLLVAIGGMVLLKRIRFRMRRI